MLIAAFIALGLIGYLNVSRTALKLSHRTYFANDASNLAEAGIEEALYCFNLMAAGTAPASAWSGWTLSGTTATRTFSPVARAQNAVAVMKVYVAGYDGSTTLPYVVSQVTITPFDRGAPIVKVLKCSLQGSADLAIGAVALDELRLRGNTFADSFNSNPSGSPTGPWLPYSTAIARSRMRIYVAAGGTVNIAAGAIRGDLLLGPGVTPPPANEVTGTIYPNQNYTFTMPAYPTTSSVTRSYNLGSTIPATLPVAGHQPASDGWYYYFCNGATISNVNITAGRKVAIVGANTDMEDGLMVAPTASCTVYMDGVLNCSGSINTTSWAGALRIYTTTTKRCTLRNNSHIYACFYAPNADFRATGGGRSGTLAGFYLARAIDINGEADLHYDEAIAATTGSTGWKVTQWLELHSAADRATIGTLTGDFLP